MRPLVCGYGLNALWQIRELGMAGIRPAHYHSNTNDMSMKSLFGDHFTQVPSEECIVYDYWPGMELGNSTYVVLPKQLDLCLDKKAMYEEASRLGIPCPAPAKPGRPSVVKPRIKKGASPVYQSDHTPINGDVISQEYIPGPVKNLWTVTSFSNLNGEFVVGSVGHKLLQYPSEQVGTIVSGRVVHNERVYQLAQKLLNGIGYDGLSNIEFKYDARDDTYKFIEINPRLGKWHSSAFLANNLNLPLMRYCDIINITTHFTKIDRDFVWTDAISQFLRFRKFGGTDAVWHSQDRAPFWFHLRKSLRRKQ